MRIVRTLFLLVTTFFLVSCGSQTTLPSIDSDAVRAKTEEQIREAKRKAEKRWKEETDIWLANSRKVGEVAANILTGGEEYCEEREHIGPYIGTLAWSKYDFDEKWHKVALAEFGLEGGAQVYFVSAGSPAEIGGLKFGDLILSINNQPVARGKKAVADFEKKIKETAKIGVPIQFVIQRDATHQTISITPSKACKSQVFLTRDESIDAHADGEKIILHNGLMEYLNTLDEIALIVSHELAHNSMKHSLVRRINAGALAGVGFLLGTTIDVGVGALLHAPPTQMLGWEWGKIGYDAGLGVNTVELEREADYVGLYFMALSGHNIDSTPQFWLRIAELDPKKINIRSAHPTSAERFVGMEAAIKEINEKKQAGLPRRPERPTIFRNDFAM